MGLCALFTQGAPTRAISRCDEGSREPNNKIRPHPHPICECFAVCRPLSTEMPEVNANLSIQLRLDVPLSFPPSFFWCPLSISLFLCFSLSHTHLRSLLPLLLAQHTYQCFVLSLPWKVTCAHTCCCCWLLVAALVRYHRFKVTRAGNLTFVRADGML